MHGRGLFFAERPLMKARDFRQHIFGLGFHFKVRQVAVLMIHDPQFVLNRIEHLQHPGQLMFGQQADVQIQVGAMLGFFAQAVVD